MNTTKIVVPTTIAITYTIPSKIEVKEVVATVLRAVNAAYYMGVLS